jgi:hypothetical protein
MAVAGSVLAGVAMPAGAATADRQDRWDSVSGAGICGLHTSVGNGGDFALVVAHDALHLLARDPSWHMHPNWQVRVVFTAADQHFQGDAIATDGQTLVVTNLSRGFLKQFVAGAAVEANFGGVRWTVHPIGSADAIGDMVSCFAAARFGAGA